MIRLIGKVERIDRGAMVVNSTSYTEVILSVKRNSGAVDHIILVFNDQKFRFTEGTYVDVTGDVRTYKEENEGLKTRVKVSVTDMKEVDFDSLTDEEKTMNLVEDDVIIIKANKMRRTPNKLRITDLKVGKTSTSGKFYTYAAIAWGSNAKHLSERPYGVKLHIIGRLQERQYLKRNKDGERRLNTYEVSISKVEEIGCEV